MKYLKVWTDFDKVLAPLSDAEIGRLFLAMLQYAGTGEEPSEFAGNEAFLWAVAKRDIDMMSEKDEKLRQNGSKGGIAKSKSKQTLANFSKFYQTEPLPEVASEDVTIDSLKEKKRKEIERKEIELSSSFIDDDDAHKIQAEQDRVLDAAEDAGFMKSNSVRAGLLKLYAEYGLEKMLAGFESCVKHGAANLAYLEACLKDTPKKPKAKVVAQDYTQRDYSTDPDFKKWEEENQREIEEAIRKMDQKGAAS